MKNRGSIFLHTCTHTRKGVIFNTMCWESQTKQRGGRGKTKRRRESAFERWRTKTEREGMEGRRERQIHLYYVITGDR